MAEKDFIVTPWEVVGDVDYTELVKRFGTQEIDEALLARIKKHAPLHYMLRRKIFFSHRDLDWVLGEYEKGNKFFLYTGRGPSDDTHLGHLVPWIFTKYLQDSFGSKLYFQMTDDEKFLFKEKLSREETHSLAYENALDVIALGFDSKKTMIFADTDVIDFLYPHALEVAKKVTFSTAKAVFGFTNETNIGGIFFTSIQSVPAFIESIKQKKPVPCLIPHAIDQDPHFRITRDVAPKIGFPKPSSIHCKFLPSLKGSGKMSSSGSPDSMIYTTDSPEEVERKIMSAFTGGRDTIEEQKRLGGRPEICPIFSYYTFLFETDDEKLKEIEQQCRSGKLMCGEDKARLCERVKKFLAEHQKNREAARKQLSKFMAKKI
ncbi:tryptophan--tRNA ligase [Candidatus Micrarchaeota archaeon]|nr:tryptophan--tRNA ligase [Candidatus Micrarchaeota archaeon]